MNTFIVLAVVIAVAVAKPLNEGVALTQDTAGNYKLKYETVDIARSEQGFEGGKVMGSYTYTDKEGGHHTIKYLSSPTLGFTAEGDVPRQVLETPEVAAARSAHLAIVEKERATLPHLSEMELHHGPQLHHVPQFTAPLVARKPVVDNSADIAAATAEHFAAHEKARAYLAEVYRSTPTKTVEYVPVPKKAVHVDNTAELMAITAEHFAAHQDALAQLADAYSKAPKKSHF